jgi:hypothetical protein
MLRQFTTKVSELTIDRYPQKDYNNIFDKASRRISKRGY